MDFNMEIPHRFYSISSVLPVHSYPLAHIGGNMFTKCAYMAQIFIKQLYVYYFRLSI